MRKFRFLSGLSICGLLIAGPATAQSFDNERVCPGLQKSGLYYAYADGGGNVVVQPVGSGPLRYNVNSRFYYVPRARASFSDRNDEGIWHVRTQTIAAAAPRANTAYVYRPPIVSRCSNGAVLNAFSPDARFVELNRYIDYHAPNRNGREQELQLRDYFHFEMQNPETGKCGIRTDDSAALGNLQDIYAFKAIRREDTPTPYEVATSLSSPAYARTSIYQGLSSEFAYREMAGMSCISFSPPLPTGPVPRRWFSSVESAAIEAAASWKPRSTFVVLKRFHGARVVELLSRSVNWDGQ